MGCGFEGAIKRAWVAVPSRKLWTGSNVANELMVRIEFVPFLRSVRLLNDQSSTHFGVDCNVSVLCTNK